MVRVFFLWTATFANVLAQIYSMVSERSNNKHMISFFTGVVNEYLLTEKNVSDESLRVLLPTVLAMAASSEFPELQAC
jgi:hypothetical protein